MNAVAAIGNVLKRVFCNHDLFVVIVIPVQLDAGSLKRDIVDFETGAAEVDGRKLAAVGLIQHRVALSENACTRLSAHAVGQLIGAGGNHDGGGSRVQRVS